MYRFLLLPFLFFAYQLSSALIITEVMPCPAQGARDREYIELYNSGPGTVSGTSYSISRTGGSPASLSAASGSTASIRPGCYALITTPSGAEYFSTAAPAGTVILTDGKNRITGYGLSDNGMTVQLLEENGQRASECSWSQNPGQNCSLERSTPLEGSGWRTNPWGGTPGYPNRFWICRPPAERIRITEPVCRPEANTPLGITVRTNPGETVILSILTLRGKKIRRITIRSTLAGVSVVWYGRNDCGDPCSSGCYLLVCRITENGTLRYTGKKPVILMRP